jgi:hypothetical protein
MTYKELIDKIEQYGIWDDQVKLQSMHTNDVFKITTLHLSKEDVPYEDIKSGDLILDIELNNY